MDAYHYDKIADKLIQFHSKLPNSDDLEFKLASMEVTEMKILIEQLLKRIDNMARKDENGWIR
tara:strand:- start:1435 stop:1623 length:189 start_codon:yes stop_codon:yes gene_type:complete